MDKTMLISMIVFIFTNIGTILGMFLWVRGEANADRREMDSKFYALLTEVKEDRRSK